MGHHLLARGRHFLGRRAGVVRLEGKGRRWLFGALFRRGPKLAQEAAEGDLTRGGRDPSHHHSGRLSSREGARGICAAGVFLPFFKQVRQPGEYESASSFGFTGRAPLLGMP